MLRTLSAWALIVLGLAMIAYMSLPVLLEGHMLTAIFLAFPGGLPLGLGIGLLDRKRSTPPKPSDSTQG